MTKGSGVNMSAILGLILAVLLISGCNEDGGESSPPLLEGKFIDSPVEGLEYETETQSGVTDMDGTFMYQEGETVTFHLGDVVLGEGAAKSVMTPLDLVEDAVGYPVDITHAMATNMVRFLQTLDEDMDPENGITITEAMIAAMTDQMIDFNMPSDMFAYDPNVQIMMHKINNMNPSTDRMMVSVEDAQAHFSDTMIAMMSGDDTGMGNDSGMIGNGTGMVSDNADMMTDNDAMGSSDTMSPNGAMGSSANGMMN